MGSFRNIYLESNENELRIEFGTYCMMLFYANELNPAEAQKIYEVTQTEYSFRSLNELDTTYIDSDLEDAHFDIVKMAEVINFINNSVIPALQSENEDLIEKFGGLEIFVNLFVEGFLREVSVFEHDCIEGDPIVLRVFYEQLRDFLQAEISKNSGYTTVVY